MTTADAARGMWVIVPPKGLHASNCNKSDKNTTRISELNSVHACCVAGRPNNHLSYLGLKDSYQSEAR